MRSLIKFAAAALGALFIATAATATPVTYTMTWNSVSGTLGSTPFTNKKLVVTLDADTDDLQSEVIPNVAGKVYLLSFPKGAGVKVTLDGTALNASTLDAVVANDTRLTVGQRGSIFLQRALAIGTDIASHGFVCAEAPAATATNEFPDRLATEWTCTSFASIGSKWAELPFVIGGLELKVNTLTAQVITGSWGVVFRPKEITATAITSVTPSPVASGASYTVSGTVTVTSPAAGAASSAPAKATAPDLRGKVSVSGDGTCEDTSLAPSASPGVYEFSCSLTAGTAGAKTLTAAYSGTGYEASEGTGSQTVTAPPTFSVGGSASGLGAGKTAVLQNNGSDDLTVSANGAFTFATPVATGGAYAVTVKTQPAGQQCVISGGSGTMGAANVTALTMQCYDRAAASSSLPGGPVSATITGGTCAGFDGTSVSFGAPVNPPADAGSFNYGVFGFTAKACGAGGTITVTLKYPQPLPPGTRHWKQVGGNWVDWTNKVTIAGDSVTLTITDGGEGDNNPNPGEIGDPSGPALPKQLAEPVNVPVFSPWVLAALGLLVGFAGYRNARRQRG